MVSNPAGPTDGASSMLLPVLCVLIVLGGVAATSTMPDVRASDAVIEDPPVVDPAHVYCPVCGARNKAGSRFCARDGSPLPDVNHTQRVAGFKQAAETFSSTTIQRTMESASR